jgi:radical SAM superfamily enzyme YgiQ (UPF0313 family)
MKAVFLKPYIGKHGKNIVRDFVYGCWCNGKRIGGMQMPPLAELYAATHVRQDEVEPVMLDAQIQPGEYEKLINSRFDGVMAVAVMSSTQSFRNDVKTLEQIKGVNPTVKTILFGSHPTFMPEYCLREPAVDFIVMREPEESLRVLMGAIRDWKSVEGMAGVGYKVVNGQPKIGPARQFLSMDDLPIPDRSLLPKGVDYFNPVVRRLPYTTMQTSRGCPARCIFCTAPTFFGNKARARSVEKTLEEIREVKRLGYREIFFRDETFTAYKKRNTEICEGMLSENLDMSWIANGRVDMIDREQMELMKKAGCHMLKFGVETGSEELLKSYNKGTTIEQAQRAFRYAREVGIDAHAHIIFGGAGETLDTIKNTIDFVIDLEPFTASFGIVTPYPGTELFDSVAHLHPEILDGSDSNMDNLHTMGFFSESICGIPGDELSRRIVQAYRKFYMRPAYLLKRLFKIRSADELVVQLIAGMNIFQFAATGEK